MLNPNVSELDLRGPKPELQRKRSRRKRDILLSLKLLELEFMFDQERPLQEMREFVTDMCNLVRRMHDEARREEEGIDGEPANELSIRQRAVDDREAG